MGVCAIACPSGQDQWYGACFDRDTSTSARTGTVRQYTDYDSSWIGTAVGSCPVEVHNQIISVAEPQRVFVVQEAHGPCEQSCRT